MLELSWLNRFARSDFRIYGQKFFWRLNYPCFFFVCFFIPKFLVFILYFGVIFLKNIIIIISRQLDFYWLSTGVHQMPNKLATNWSSLQWPDQSNMTWGLSIYVKRFRPPRNWRVCAHAWSPLLFMLAYACDIFFYLPPFSFLCRFYRIYLLFFYRFLLQDFDK